MKDQFGSGKFESLLTTLKRHILSHTQFYTHTRTTRGLNQSYMSSCTVTVSGSWQHKHKSKLNAAVNAAKLHKPGKTPPAVPRVNVWKVYTNMTSQLFSLFQTFAGQDNFPWKSTVWINGVSISLFLFLWVNPTLFVNPCHHTLLPTLWYENSLVFVIGYQFLKRVNRFQVKITSCLQCDLIWCFGFQRETGFTGVLVNIFCNALDI